MIRRWLLRIVISLAALAVLIPAAFLGVASIRENVPPGSDGKPGRYASLPSNIDIHYQSWGPEDGPAIILIHGTVAWSETWTPIVTQLADAGYHVLAADFPPFGYSTRPADNDYSRPAFAGRILDFADALGIDQFMLVGHSFGGGGTVEAAFSAPHRIAGLALLDPAMRLSAPTPDKPLGPLLRQPFVGNAIIATTFTNPLTTGYGLRSFIKDPAIASPERVAIYKQPLEVEGTTEAVRHWFLNGLFGDESQARSANRGNYRNFTKPVQLIWGREDTVTPLAQGEEIAALFPDAKLSILENVNHIPQIEAPSETAKLLVEFASRIFTK